MNKSVSFIFSAIILLVGVLGLRSYYNRNLTPGSMEFASYESSPEEGPAVVSEGADLAYLNSDDIRFVLSKMLDRVKSGKALSQQNCAEKFRFIYKRFYQGGFQGWDVAKALKHAPEIIAQSFQLRLALRDQLRRFQSEAGGAQNVPKACVDGFRNGMKALRFAEDFIGEVALLQGNESIPDTKKKFAHFDPTKVPDDGPKKKKKEEIPELEKQNLAEGTLQEHSSWNAAPWLLLGKDENGQKIENGKLLIESGDVFLSRGNAYTSAAIAKITEVGSQFSHLAIVYVRGNKSYTIEQLLGDKYQEAFIVEAHIEVGNTIRYFRDYLHDGNARVLHFRAEKESVRKVAHQAAKNSFIKVGRINKKAGGRRGYALNEILGDKDLDDYSDSEFDRIVDVHHKSPDTNVQYDFMMSLDDDGEKIFCSEGPHLGYKYVGFDFPTYKSPLLDIKFRKKLGIKGDRVETFAPGDMDVETGFYLLAEWRDYRKVRALRYKDFILSRMFQWMDQKDYEFRPKAMDGLTARAGWLLRRVPFVRRAFYKKLPKNMKLATMKLVLTLDRAGEIIEEHLRTANEAKMAAQMSSGQFPLGLTPVEMEKSLDQFRLDDEFVYLCNTKGSAPDRSGQNCKTVAQMDKRSKFHKIFHK